MSKQQPKPQSPPQPKPQHSPPPQRRENPPQTNPNPDRQKGGGRPPTKK